MFFQQGAVDVGYELNKKTLYKIRIKTNLVVGAFYATFLRRAMFTVKASKDCWGFSIGSLKWNQELARSPHVSKMLKIKILDKFYADIRRPMMRKKLRDIQNI